MPSRRPSPVALPPITMALLAAVASMPAPTRAFNTGARDVGTARDAGPEQTSVPAQNSGQAQHEFFAPNTAPTPCADAVSRQLRAWDVTATPWPQPPRTSGAVLRHWPTAQRGVWVVEEVGPERSAAVRVAPDQLTRVDWSATCAPRVATSPRPLAPPPRFSDADLEAVVSGARGVIYLWSPHMPLSVDGYAQLTLAARTRALTVTALLDPAADRAFAKTSLVAGGLPAEALRVADSVELQFRDVALHAPAIVVHAGGRLVATVLRGYRTSAEYGEFLDRALAAPARDVER